MTDSEGKQGPIGTQERYSVYFLCLVTSATASREGYTEAELERALHDARTLHGVVVRASDGAYTADGTTWSRGRRTGS
jgi:hypothetical protein